MVRACYLIAAGKRWALGGRPSYRATGTIKKPDGRGGGGLRGGVSEGHLGRQLRGGRVRPFSGRSGGTVGAL